MHIALVNSEYPSLNGRGHGGIATYVYTMANALIAGGHNVSVLARKDTIPGNLHNSVSFYTYDFLSPSTPFSFISRIFNNKIYWERGCSKGALDVIKNLHKKTPINVVEIPDYNGLASQFRRVTPFSKVINFHTPSIIIDECNQVSASAKENRWYAYEKNALKNADAFRCPSKGLAERVNKLYAIPLKDISVIHNPISPKIFDKIKKMPVAKDETVCEILFSGRLERRKGAEIILNAIKDILKIDEKIRVTFAGETEIGGSVDYRQIIERSLEPDERDRVWFLGSISREKLLLLYRRSDIFIIPSLFENAPYTLLEAMSARLPVVGADTCGINEMIQHEKTGLLFPLNNLEQLCTCVKNLFSNPELREQLVDNAYQHVNTYYNPEKIAEQAVDFYQTVINNK